MTKEDQLFAVNRLAMFLRRELELGKPLTPSESEWLERWKKEANQCLEKEMKLASTEQERTLAEPSELERFANDAQSFRRDLLLANDEGLDCVPEQHLLLAMNALADTIAHLRLASFHQARALAGNR